MNSEFSKLELVVNDLLKAGRSGREIGEELKVVSGTVYQVIKRIREKEKARRLLGLNAGDDAEEATLP
jgi:DNA-binding NarL/FixJ family response regulator